MVGYDKLGLNIYFIWRRKWQPTPVFLPGESHGQRSLAGYCPLGHTESDTTEATWHEHSEFLCISSLKRSMLSTIKPYQTDSTVVTTERMELPLIDMGGQFL